MLDYTMQQEANSLTEALQRALETWAESGIDREPGDDSGVIVVTDIVITAAAQFVTGFVTQFYRQLPEKALRALVERYETALWETGRFGKPARPGAQIVRDHGGVPGE